MFSRLRKTKHKGLAAVMPDSTGVSVARVESNAVHVKLRDCAFQARDGATDSAGLLTSLSKEHQLDQYACTTLLDIGDYQLLLVEAPEVPPAELRAAIRWRVREMIDFHVDDAMVDVFDAPASAARGIQDHLYAVVARSALVQERVDQIQNAGANLEVIDIPELALRNIVARLPEDANGVAMLYFAEDRGLVTLIRDSTLYLARTLELGYRDFAAAGADPSHLWDQLALEVQRSMDYYDRHFQQANISNVLIAPLPETVPGLEEGLQQNLGLPVRSVALDEVVELEAPVNQEQAAHCFLAVGAALRKEKASL